MLLKLRLCYLLLFLLLPAMAGANQVVRFVLVDADTDADIATLIGGGTVNLATLPTRNLNVRAETDPAAVDSVAISLSGATEASGTEGVAPYALWGDSGGNYNAGAFNTGSHVLTATPTLNGTQGTPLSINFNVTDDDVGLPVADAGPDQTVVAPDDTAVLSGSGRDDDGTIDAYLWTQLNGPNTAVMNHADTDTVTLTGLIPGTYALRLTVTDNDGHTADDDVLVFVSPHGGAQGGTFLEENGILVMEAENGTPESADQWTIATDVPDYRGGGFIRWEGADHFNDKTHGVLAFRVRIVRDGTYHLRLRAFHDPAAHGTTNDQENDAWTNHQADSTTAMHKTFRPGGTAGQPWTICGTWEPTHGNFVNDPTLELTAGDHIFRIAARSRNFMIDRIYLVQDTADLDPGLPESTRAGGMALSGELRKWHKVTLTFDGPETHESATPNPFTDYRLTVTFTNGATTHVVPGYYAADGNAADSGASSGSKWRAHLAPDKTGTWTWRASFRTGAGIAVSEDPLAGTGLSPLDGLSGAFEIDDTDKAGRDHRGKGRLAYIGEHYLKFSETGEYFLKQGADAPENFLAYDDFDNTPDNGGRRKSWSAHAADWRDGDPTWMGDKGRGIIGAVNYLSSEGMNAFSFIPMNIGGDDRNVFPYISDQAADRRRMDCSKLDQWEVVFAHADRMGMFLHFKTQETENELLLDGGDLGPERKLYYRELIARFGHHLALNWNLGEEINNASTAQKQAWAQYFHDTDPYHHHIVIHNMGNPHHDLLGSASKLTGFSLQTSRSDFSQVHSRVADYLQRSADAGRPWAVACDEPGDASHALRPDDDAGNSHEDGRKNALWGTFMAGGWGNEWYFGYQHAHSDLTCQDFRSRDQWWDYCRHALGFFNDNDIPFWQMATDNALSSADDDYCFYQDGRVYVIYLKNGGVTDLDLRGVAGDFDVLWFDPRNGGSLRDGSVTTIPGGDWASLGTPPDATDRDWVALVREAGAPNMQPTANAGTDQTVIDTDDSGNEAVTLDGTGSDDPDGAIAGFAWSEGGVQIATGSQPTVDLDVGVHTITLTVRDADSGTDTDTVEITVDAAVSGNQPPVIDAMPSVGTGAVSAGTAAALQVDATDPDGQTLTYTWSVVSGPGTVAISPNGTDSSDVCEATFETAGDYVLRVAVSDGDTSVSADLAVSVNQAGGGSTPPPAAGGGGGGSGGGCFIHSLIR